MPLLEKTARDISSLVVTGLRRSGNFTVFVVGSPRLHECSNEAAAAFLSESINREIITGRYLRRDSDPTISEGGEVFRRTRGSHYWAESGLVNKRRRWL